MSESSTDPVANLSAQAIKAFETSVNHLGSSSVQPAPQIHDSARLRPVIHGISESLTDHNAGGDVDHFLQEWKTMTAGEGAGQENLVIPVGMAGRVSHVIDNLRTTADVQNQTLTGAKAQLEDLIESSQQAEPRGGHGGQAVGASVSTPSINLSQASLEASAPMMLVGRHRYAIAWALLVLAVITLIGGIVMIALSDDDAGIALMTGVGTVVSILGAWFITMGYGSVRINAGSTTPAKGVSASSGSSGGSA